MDYAKLSVADLKSKLNAANVPFASNAIKSKLIALLQANKLQDQLKHKDITLTITDAALDALVRVGYDVQFGARPLKRALQKYITNPLSIHVLAGDFTVGDSIILDANDLGNMTFNKA